MNASQVDTKIFDMSLLEEGMRYQFRRSDGHALEFEMTRAGGPVHFVSDGETQSRAVQLWTSIANLTELPVAGSGHLDQNLGLRHGEYLVYVCDQRDYHAFGPIAGVYRLIF